MQWLNIVGMTFTAAGVLVGFYWPEVGAQWADENSALEELWLRARYFLGVALVLLGTALQIYVAWPP